MAFAYVAELLIPAALLVIWIVALHIAPELLRAFIRIIDDIL